MSEQKGGAVKHYKCGDCGIESPENKWVFDWEDEVENVIWLVCPHCGVRSSKEALET